MVPYTATDVPVYRQLSTGRVRQHLRHTTKYKLCRSTDCPGAMSRGVEVARLLVTGKLTANMSVVMGMQINEDARDEPDPISIVGECGTGVVNDYSGRVERSGSHRSWLRGGRGQDGYKNKR